MEKVKKLNWGIMGAGVIAKRMANALKKTPQNHLYGIASKTPSRAKIFADENGVDQTYSYQELVTSKAIDVVYVATTHNFHFENAKLALENGKHVLIEKPFTVNANEARELVRIARKKKLFLMEAMWVRFLPAQKTLKKMLKNQEIGEIKECNITFGGIVSPKYETRLKDPNLAGGVTLDMGIYPISFICNVLGEIPVEIKSMTRFSDLGVDEIANYMFRFPSGCLVNICTSFNLHMIDKAIIYGSKGYIEYPQFQVGQRFTVSQHNGTNEIVNKSEVHEPCHDNGFVYQVEEVFRCINEGRLESEIISLDETVKIMEVMDKMRNEWGFKYPFE